MKQLVLALVLLIGMSSFCSCDSREDWFAKEGEGVSFIIRTSKSIWWSGEEKYEFRNDTVYSDNNRVIEYNVKLNRIKYVENYYESRVDYRTEGIFIDIEGIGRNINKTNRDINVTKDKRDPRFVKLNGERWFYFTDEQTPTTSNDTIAPVLNTAHLVIELEDAFRNNVYCHVKINCLGDIAPVPAMEIKDVEGNPMEKILDLSKSSDKDGSVVKYEYCIDGEIIDYDLPTYDCDPAGTSAGKGAYGGTYITSTELSEVKHAFQKKGQHIVFFRCMDNLGLWSVWHNSLITVNK